MGLDTTHGAWHGSYGAFACWRNTIAHAIGWLHYTPEDPEDFWAWHNGNYSIPQDRIPVQAPIPDEVVTTDGETYTVQWSKHYDNGVYLGRWEKDPEDVLDVLMLHSDVEGIIPHRFCMPLAQRLLALREQQPEWARDLTADFAAGLLRANKRGEDVDFR